MKNLIKAERFKMVKSGYRVLCILCFLWPLIPVILVFLGEGMEKKSGYYGFRVGICYAFEHVNFGFLFVVLFFCAEWKNRCFGMSLLHGASRGEVFFSKVIAFFEGMCLLSLIYLLGWTVFSTLLYGFGKELTLGLLFDMVFWTLIGMLGVITISSVLVFVSTIGRNAFFTLILLYVHYAPLAFAKNNFWYYAWIGKLVPYLRFTYVFQIYSVYEDSRGNVYQLWMSDGNMLGAKYMSFHPGLYLAVNLLTSSICLVSAFLLFRKTELK